MQRFLARYRKRFLDILAVEFVVIGLIAGTTLTDAATGGQVLCNLQAGVNLSAQSPDPCRDNGGSVGGPDDYSGVINGDRSNANLSDYRGTTGYGGGQGADYSGTTGYASGYGADYSGVTGYTTNQQAQPQQPAPAPAATPAPTQPAPTATGNSAYGSSYNEQLARNNLGQGPAPAAGNSAYGSAYNQQLAQSGGAQQPGPPAGNSSYGSAYNEQLARQTYANQR